MGSRLEELLGAIRAAPDDDELRLVFADALEEAGEKLRAEYIRIAIAGGDSAPMLKAHRAELGGPALAAYGLPYSFERGIPRTLRVKPSVFVDHAAAILTAGLIDGITLGNEIDNPDDEYNGGPDATAEMGAKVAAVPELARLRTVYDFGMCGPPEFAEPLLASPHLGALEELWFHYWQASDFADIVTKYELPALTRLVFAMESDGRGDAIAEQIAARRLGLVQLGLTGLEVSDAGVEAIAKAKWPALSWLIIGGTAEAHTELGADGMTALAATTAPLTQLELNDAELASDDVALLAEARFALTHLSLRGNGFDALDALWTAPFTRTLTSLDVSSNQLADTGIAALTKAPFFAQLRALDVSSNYTGEAGLESLIGSSLAADVPIVIGSVLESKRVDAGIAARFRARFPKWRKT